MNISSRLWYTCDEENQMSFKMSISLCSFILFSVFGQLRPDLYSTFLFRQSFVGMSTWKAWGFIDYSPLSLPFTHLFFFWIKSLYFHRFPYREKWWKVFYFFLFLLLSTAQKFFMKFIHDVSNFFFVNYSTNFC